jgi:hypothetical protein
MTNVFDAVIAAFENKDPIALAGGGFAFLSIFIYLTSRVFFRDQHLGRYAVVSLTLSFFAIAYIALTYEMTGYPPEDPCERCPEMIAEYEDYRIPLIKKTINSLGANHGLVQELRLPPDGELLGKLKTEEMVRREIDDATTYIQQSLRDYGR